MKRLNQHLNLALKFAGIVALLAVAFLVIEVSHTVSHTDQLIVASQHELFDKGGVADIAKATLLHVDRATGEAAIASRQQRALAETISKEVLHTLRDADATVLNVDHSIGLVTTDLHASLENMDTAVSTLNTALKDVSPLLDSSRNLVEQGNRTIVSANTLLSDPQIQQAVHHINGVAANLEGVAANFNGVSQDVRGVVHKKANPTRVQKWEDQVIFGLKTSFYLSWLFK